MNPDIKSIFDYWNSKPNHCRWKKWRVIVPVMEKAVSMWLKRGYTVEYMKETIDNFYNARITPGNWWHDEFKKKWSIAIFFGGGIKKDQMNCFRFTPEEFEMEDMWTPQYKSRTRTESIKRARRAEEVRQKAESYGDYIRENRDNEKALSHFTDDVIREALR